jgi:hypothetical protein
VRRHVDEWEKFLETKTKSEQSVTNRWTGPETVKINIDAAFWESSESSGNGGWGAIHRNSDSEVCFVMSGPLVKMRDAFHAEATTLSHAIQVVDSLGVGRVVFETDCINLKQAWAWAAWTDLAGMSRAWAVFFPMGGPGLQIHGPTAYPGWAWAESLDDFGKVRPDSLTARPKLAHSGRAWAEISGPTVGPGLGRRLFLGPARPGPRRCPGMT